MAIPDDILETLKPVPYADVRDDVRDGDILLCSAHDPFSNLIRWATKSPWSHVAIAFRMPEVDRVIVLECVDKIGVRAVPLSAFIAQTSSGRKPYPGKILLARHAGLEKKRTPAHLKKIYKFALDRCGDRFAPGEILKIGMRALVGRLDRKMPKALGPHDEYICSEYVALCFEQVGIEIEWDKKGFIAPADFALDPKVKAVAQMKTK
jgi:hypothetical protein